MRHVGLMFVLACGPKIPGATTPATSADLGAVADRVVAELPLWEGFAGFDDAPHVVVLPTDNRTKFKFDSHVATAKLVNGLIRGSRSRFDVIDPETWRVRQAPPKKVPAADAAPPKSGTPVPDGDLLLLHSEVRSTRTTAEGRVAEHVLVTYRLVESDSARALWGYTMEWTKARGDDGFELVQGSPSAVAPPPPEPAVGSPASAARDAAASVEERDRPAGELTAPD